MDTKRAEAMTHARLEVVEAFASCLPPLLNYARRRLRFHMALGDIGPRELSVEDIVDATFVEAIDRRAERPTELGYCPWRRLLTCTACNAKPMLLDDVVEQASSERWPRRAQWQLSTACLRAI